MNPFRAAPLSMWLRLMFSVSLLAAGPVMTGFGAWMVWVVWRGGWAAERAAQQLDILGTGLMTVLGGMVAIIVAVALGGPVGRLKGSVGRVSAEVSDDDDSRTVTLATEAGVVQSVTPKGAGDGMA